MARYGSLRLRPLLLAAAILLAVAVPGFGQGGAPGGASGGAQGGASSGGGKPASSETAESGDRARPSGARGGSDGSTSVVPAAGDAEYRFAAWLESSREGARLADVRERLRLAAGPALRAGAPLDAFVSRVREAAAKGAPPALVADAVEADAARWTWLAGSLAGEDWPPDDAATDLYLAVATAFRNGLDARAVSGVVSWARGSGSRAGRAVAALSTAAAVSAEFGGEGAGDSARILAASRLGIGRYDDVAALAAKAARAGISAAKFESALAATIGEGGSLADLERSLFN